MTSRHVTSLTFSSSDRPPGEGVVGIFDSDEEDEDFYDAMDNSSEANNGNVAAVTAAPKVEPPTAVAPLDTGKSTLSTRVSSFL